MRHVTVKQRGFTLVEMIVAMVVVAIIATTVAVFIRMPIENYRSTVARTELVDEADHALRMIARDVRLALPGSVRVSGGTTLELLQTRTAGRYLAEVEGHASLQHLDFLNSATTSFAAIGDLPTGRQAIQAGDYLVVNNVGVGVTPGDAYQAAGFNRATISGTATTAVTNTYAINLQTNPFASQVPPIPSPNSRFHVVTGPVSYQCVAGSGGTGTLKRYKGYAITSSQPTSLSNGGLLSNHVVSCSFTYAAVNERISMLSISLVLQGASLVDGPITLTHQVHF